MLAPCYFSVPVSPVGLVVLQAAQHFWFLRPRPDDPSRNWCLTYRKDYIAKHMLGTWYSLLPLSPALPPPHSPYCHHALCKPPSFEFCSGICYYILIAQSLENQFYYAIIVLVPWHRWCFIQKKVISVPKIFVAISKMNYASGNL